MAKTSSIEKNNKRKKMSKQFGNKRAKLKAITMDHKLTIEDRFAAQLKLSEMPRNSSATRIRNRCEFSGRARGYYRKLKLSRIALRHMSHLGQVPGMVKSSW
ncbi:MAG: 30S ribosomal protein S14 [Devosia sp.]